MPLRQQLLEDGQDGQVEQLALGHGRVHAAGLAVEVVVAAVAVAVVGVGPRHVGRALHVAQRRLLLQRGPVGRVSRAGAVAAVSVAAHHSHGRRVLCRATRAARGTRPPPVVMVVVMVVVVVAVVMVGLRRRVMMMM